MQGSKIDLVYERQWRPMPYPVLALQRLGLMGTLYGGFPKKRYIAMGIPANSLQTFPFAALMNYAADAAHLPRAFRLEEPRWVGSWVAKRKDLAPTIWTNGTVHRFLFPKLEHTGRKLILERGSTHPIDFYTRPQLARKEAGYAYSTTIPSCAYDEIEKTKLADGIFAASQYVRDSYVERGFSPDVVYDCSFGIDTGSFPFIQRALATDRPIRIGIVGVIGFRKGLHRLLKIGDWAARKGIHLEFHFAGPIQDPEANEMFSRSHSVCRLHGTVKGMALRELLASFDLYALPSYEEGLPFSVLEAMSTGLAPIVSNDTGAREPVQHAVSGLILNRFDDDEFDAELEPVLTNPDRILAMGCAARARIEEHYTLDHYCQRISEALAKMEG